MENLVKKFKGKKVLVTGHTGFKGAWLSLWLLELGALVTGYSLSAKPTRPNLFEISGLRRRLSGQTLADIRDTPKLRECFKKTQPQVVFHLAAQPLVRRSYMACEETYSTNVMGTLNILEAARSTPSVRVCQIITSDKCYLNTERQKPYSEEDALGGKDPYSASKACAEILVAAHRESFFDWKKTSVSSVRAGNVIGGGDWAEDRIIADCARALSKKKKIEIRNPQAIRPWQYVLDALSGYLWLASKQMDGDRQCAAAWNFGPQEKKRLNVSQLASRFINCWGLDPDSHMIYKITKKDSPAESHFLTLSIEKAAKKLSWKPTYSVDEALRDTGEWYKCFYENPSTSPSVTLRLLHRFTECARQRRQIWSI